MNLDTPKILLLRFSSIGDIVLTTPVLRALKQQFNHGDVEVHFVCKQGFKPVLANNPYVDQLFTYSKSPEEIYESLKAEQYHYVFDLQKNLRSKRLISYLGVMSFSFDKLNLKKWMWIHLGIDQMPDVHIVDRYFEVTRSFDIKNDGQGLDYFLSDTDRVDLAAFPTLKAPFVAIAIGGNHAGKVMPKHKINAILSQLTVPVALLGGPEDAEIGNELAQSHEHVVNFAGALKLNESASVLEQSAWVIAHDTGLMHIASAFKKPIVSVWGATTPSLGMYPYLPGEKSKMIQPEGASQRPYSKLGNKKWYAKAYDGWKHLNIEKIIEAIEL